MALIHHAIRRWAVLSTLVFLFASGPLASVATVASPASPDADNPRWPRVVVASNGAAVTMYHPQIADWPRQSAVTLYAAVSYRPKGAARAAFGTIVAEANTAVMFRERLVRFSRPVVVDAHFPSLSAPDVAEIVAAIERTMPSDGQTVALEAVVAAMAPRSTTVAYAAGLKADPPLVFVSTRPAVLVNIDGSPVWRTAVSPALHYAVNTNWDLMRDDASNTYYLRDGQRWLTATNVLGPWRMSGAPPPGIHTVRADPRRQAPREAPNAAAPRVFVSREPAELLVFDGEPRYERVPDTAALNWVRNTDSDVFREGLSGTVYFLVAGRWFEAPDFTGPWTFATPSLPADFRKIRLGHPRSHVLASVPGTPQAAEAVLMAQLPYVARVNKKAVKAPDVTYDGTPTFQPIPNTRIARAANTDKDVILASRQYYLCFDGVWFSAATPRGPWRVTGAIPSAIYQIPPSSSLYHVTSVIVRNDYEDWTVFATTPAYYGMLAAGDTVVWGTGYGYASYVGGSGAEPIYVPRSSTYGVGAWYNPWAHTFGGARRSYGPSATAAPRVNPYDSWDPRLVQTADRSGPPRQSSRETVGTSGVVDTPPLVDRDERLFAGRDGLVYRSRGHAWERFQHGGWTAAGAASPNDAPILHQLDEDARARSESAARRKTSIELRGDWGERAASYQPAGRRLRAEP